MVEVTLKQYLETALSVPVHFERQADLAEYVLIEKTGSSVTNMINSATIAIQSYGKSMYKAASLNEDVKAAMALAPSEAKISRAKLNTDYNFSDTTHRLYRYQAVYDVVFFD